MNPQRKPRQSSPDLIQFPFTQHLTHEQLCDLLLHDDLDVLALHGDTGFSAAAADQLVVSQQHLRNCLICSSELDQLRASVARFQALSGSIASREFARKSQNPTFSSLLTARTRALSVPAFVWATAAVVVASMLPFTLFHFKTDYPSTSVAIPQPAPQKSPAATRPPEPESDAALLDSINQDLSAAVPSPMQPLAGPATTLDITAAQESN